MNQFRARVGLPALDPFEQLLFAESELRTLPSVWDTPFGGFDFESFRMATQKRRGFRNVKNVIGKTGDIFSHYIWCQCHAPCCFSC